MAITVIEFKKSDAEHEEACKWCRTNLGPSYGLDAKWDAPARRDWDQQQQAWTDRRRVFLFFDGVSDVDLAWFKLTYG